MRHSFDGVSEGGAITMMAFIIFLFCAPIIALLAEAVSTQDWGVLTTVTIIGVVVYVSARILADCRKADVSK